MAVTYKDIDDLSQKSTVAGTEKLPVSDTHYLTPEQIATFKRVHLQDESDLPISPDANTLYLIDEESLIYVLATTQTLTASQQAQARANIGAAAVESIPSLSGYAKYVLCADETAYSNIQNKDGSTLYLIPKESL